MMLRERYNTEISLRPDNRQRTAVRIFMLKPHNIAAEFIGMFVQDITGNPVVGTKDQPHS